MKHNLEVLLIFIVLTGIVTGFVNIRDGENDLNVKKSNHSPSSGNKTGGKPFFTFRGWETQVDGLWCDRPGETGYWYKNPVYLGYLDTVLREAPRYKANALILMGRGEFAEIHTFISYERWPKLHEIYKNKNAEDRELQVRRLNELIKKAKERNVDVYLWDHEIHVPGELPDLYPEMKGTGAPYCPSSPVFWKFMSDKYEEFLERVPDIAGLFLVLSETQSMLLNGSPCQCDRCRSLEPQDLLEKLIRTIYEPLHRHGKRLIIRTFGHSTAHIQRIVDAINRLPSDLDIAVMSKATPNDFFGFHYPDNPAIGAVKGREQYLEEAFGEFRGKTRIICIPAKFYTERIRNAAEKGLSGLVFRLEHNGYPRSNFASPNRFNIYLVSRLWQDPYADVDAIWKEWFTNRYGGEAARFLIPAFKATEDIWEQSTNTLGVYVSSAHGNLAPLFRGPYCAWENLNHSINNLTRGIPEWDKLGQQLLNPDDETMKKIEREIAGANELADKALKMTERAGEYLSVNDRDELIRYFELGRETAVLFGELKRIFFYSLQAEHLSGDGREQKIATIRKATRAAINEALKIENEFGRDHWPLVPDDGRGAAFYDILVDYWTGGMPDLVSGGRLPREGWKHNPLPMTGSGKLYRLLLDASRPGATRADTLEVILGKNIDEIYFAGSDVIIRLNDGHLLKMPLAMPVSGDHLIGGPVYKVSLNKQPGSLKVTAKVSPNIETQLRSCQKNKCEEVRKRILSIHTSGELEAYKKEVRKMFMDVLGPFPERTPLNPVTTGVIERDDYRIEKIILESQPGFYVPVNLYIPKGRALPMPAVLSPLGHAPKGKAHDIHDNYQARFITLARKGYIVCAFDPLGQGEREPYGAKTGNNHYVQGYQCMPSGRHLASYFIWDAMRCLDYLETRSEVDKNRIAIAGCSGGGAITNYVAALDDRIALAVPTSWIAESDFLTFDSRGLHPESWFQDICNINGPGTRQLLACIAPRPLLVIGNEYDPLFPPKSMKAVSKDIKDLYERMGAGDQMDYVVVPTKHGFWPAARRELYDFLNRHFDKQEENHDESPVMVESEKTLFCAPGGAVRNIPGAQTVYTLNREEMHALRLDRVERRRTMLPVQYRNFITNAVRKVGGLEKLEEPRFRDLGRDSILIEYEPGFFTLASFYGSPGDREKTGVVVIADDRESGSEFSIRLAQEGFGILYVNALKTNVRYGLMTGKPAPGRFAAMLLAGVKYLKNRGYEDVALTGVGKTSAWSVEFASVIGREDILAACIVNPLDRVESLSDGIAESDPLQVMLPGILRWFDETDIAANLAPMPFMLTGAVDKSGRPVKVKDLRKYYEWSLKVYGSNGVKKNFKVSGAGGSPEDIGKWLKKVCREKPVNLH